jgi:hypothetical protein
MNEMLPLDGIARRFWRMLIQGVEQWRYRMKLKFKYKVFLSFLLQSLAIMICMLLIARCFAFRNFDDYVGKVETYQCTEFAR